MAPLLYVVLILLMLTLGLLVWMAVRLLQTAEVRLKAEFENLANRIFEDKGRALAAQNGERISGLLQPLREQIEGFRKRVDEVHKDGTEQSARLLEQVRQLQALSNKVSDEANHLARAIKGDAKRQGDWGELIVERVLEASGLVVSEKIGRTRTCRIEPRVLTQAEHWIAERRALWERRLDRLGQFLDEMKDD